MSQSQTAAMLFGALVADAASLGLHWLYDPARISEIAARRGGQCAFTRIDAAHYDGTKGFFVHADKTTGGATQYGEVLRLAIGSIIRNGGFDRGAYQQDFATHFGPGGRYRGFIDRPTRGTLERIAAGRVPSGIDDDQLPATTCLPAIIAACQGHADLAATVKAAMQVTNVNDVAAAHSATFTDLLTRVQRGEALIPAIQSAVAVADPAIRPGLADAFETAEQNSTLYGEITGLTCHLPEAGPLILHILRHSDSYTAAIESNILAGGDSAGRAILIGAVMGSVHGVAGQTGIPLDWALQLTDGAMIWSDCQTIAGQAAGDLRHSRATIPDSSENKAQPAKNPIAAKLSPENVTGKAG
jgi:ADP-ribosylglycohydrolase